MKLWDHKKSVDAVMMINESQNVPKISGSRLKKRTNSNLWKTHRENKTINFYNSTFHDNKEDAWIIKNIETPAAEILNEGIRYNHDGDAFKAKKSTSMEDYE